ncbi:hypothetical protein CKA55_04590 [Arcobacter suis]|uniref:Lipoprotein n=2 Tax=Arcobacter suis TaxID=1278212 RepID=A0AAD0SRN6_9BACT|nr:hypothetical protein ASUIS_1667 [Arcobacter suis CECT 7833]RWS47272.1 hypothetical protein CKA55_04590 [Arcobacter suis]
MEWRFNLKMEIKNILKIGLFVITTSIFFTACANKSIDKKIEKPKIKTIDNVLADSFVYDSNQKLYKTKTPITKEEEKNALVSQFSKFCSEKNGKLVYTNYYINKQYVNSYSKNLANACEVDKEPYFIIHQANENSNFYYSVSIDDAAKRIYLNRKPPEFEKPAIESTEQTVQERKEIQRREIAREQKTKILLSNKSQKTMTFFDSWRDSGNKALCSTKCNALNLKTNGYKTLKEAVSDNWQLVSKVGEIEEAIDDSCTCSGYSVLVKK